MKENSKPTPNDTKLYDRLKAKAKKIFMVWPSAYASGWLTREYKSLGGTYSGGKKGEMSELERWYKEEWIDVCALPKKKRCGRQKADWEDYPYCRPNIKINKKTPKTAGELSKEEIRQRCQRKKEDPKKRIMPPAAAA